MKRKKLINPKRLIKNNFYKIFNRRINEFYHMNRDEILSYQNIRFKELLNYSIKNVPFYDKPVYRDFLKSYNNSHINHLNELPVIKKQEVKEFNNQFWSTEKFKIRTKHTTSGTSGKTITMNTFIEEKLFSLATLNFWFQKINIQPGWKIYLSGFMTPTSTSLEKFWIDEMDKSIYLSIYDINEKNLLLYEKMFNKYNPKLIYGYPSSVFEFSKIISKSEVIKKNLKFNCLKVVTTSEVLNPNWKVYISEKIGSIYNLYGSQEGAHFASTFNNGSIYNHPYYGIIETVDKQYNNIENNLGNVIVTGLNKKSMPLIRYEIGDTASIKHMEDGWDEIIDIGGRSEDLIKKPNGSKVSLLNFHASKNIEEINLSQIVQYNYDVFQIQINYIKNTTEKQKLEINKKFEKEMINRLGLQNLKITFNEVDDFEKGPNGKFKSVIVKDF